MRIELDNSRPAVVSYDKANRPGVVVKMVAPLPVPVSVGADGLTELDAAFEATRRLIHEFTDEAAQLRLFRANAKLQRRRGYSLVQSPTQYFVTLGYQGHTEQGMATHSVPVCSFVLAVVDAFNRLVEHGKVSMEIGANRQVHPVIA